MAEQTYSEEEQRVRSVAREVFDGRALTVEKVATITAPHAPAAGEIMVAIDAEHGDGTNAFSLHRLAPFLKAGFVPTSVAASEDSAKAWFNPIGAGIDVDI